MKTLFENNLHFKIIRFGAEEKELFTFDELSKSLNLTSKEERYVASYLIGYSGQDSNSYVLSFEDPTMEAYKGDVNYIRDRTCRLTSASIFEYIDYLEIKAARESSTEARRLSWIAIGISVILGIAQIIISL